MEAATKELCNKQYVSNQQYGSSRKVTPIVHILQATIFEVASTQSTQLKNDLKFEFSKGLGQIENVSFLAIATVLDPWFKKDLF